jgi:hypothetical protein
MTKIRTYQCPGRTGYPAHQFSYMHHPTPEQDPCPRYCPKCGYDSEDVEPQEALTTPHIALSIRKTVDDMHVQMEQGAQHRANIAMEHHGFDTDETNNIKMTDMKDGLREGDTSDVPVVNDVSKVMAAAPQGMFGFQGAQGLSYSSTVAQGPFPNAGAHAQSALRQAHAQSMRGSGHKGATTSSVPALETMAPGYQRRVR